MRRYKRLDKEPLLPRFCGAAIKLMVLLVELWLLWLSVTESSAVAGYEERTVYIQDNMELHLGFLLLAAGAALLCGLLRGWFSARGHWGISSGRKMFGRLWKAPDGREAFGGTENGESSGQSCGKENGERLGQSCGQENGESSGQSCGQENGESSGQSCGQENGAASGQPWGRRDGGENTPKSRFRPIMDRLKGISPADAAVYGLTAAFCLLALYWVLNTQFQSLGDSAIVLNVAEQTHYGDYSAFRDLGYAERYFNQIFTILFMRAAGGLFGFGRNLVFQILNVPALAVLLLCLWKTSGALFGPRTGRFTAVLSVCFLPLGLYVVFAYNNLYAWALAAFAVYEETLLFQNGRKRHGVGLAVAIALSIQFKMFGWVVWIAMALLAVYEVVWRKRRAALAACAGGMALTFVLGAAQTAYIDAQLDGYRRRQLTPLGYVAMGMQEGPMAPGWYNGIHDTVYFEKEGNADAMNAAYIRLIKDHAKNFLMNPGYALEFYSRKTASAWNNPSFQGFWFGEIEEAAAEVPEWIRSVYDGPLRDKLDIYLNYLLTFLHGGVVLCLLLGFRRLTPRRLLPATAFLGGFLFLLLWETKCQYALGFLPFLFGYCGCGYGELYRLGAGFRSRHKRLSPGESTKCGKQF